MSAEFLLPGIALIIVSVALGAGRRDVPAKPAMHALTVVAAVAAGTVVVVVMATSAGFLLGPAGQADIVEWCRIVALGHQVGWIEGWLALAATTAMIYRTGRVLHRRRIAVRGTEGRRMAIIETDEPMAYAAPGRPGCVVVSTGLLSALSPRERQVVFAHERAHLRQGHHRNLLVGALAVAIMPLLHPLVERLRLATERCADEEAAATLGDRELVATAIAKVAVSKGAYHGLLPAFNSGQVLARVNALIGAPPNRWATVVGVATIATGTLSSMGAGSIQLHHLWVLFDHVCRG